jgi:hypothetical protein
MSEWFTAKPLRALFKETVLENTRICQILYLLCEVRSREVDLTVPAWIQPRTPQEVLELDGSYST